MSPKFTALFVVTFRWIAFAVALSLIGGCGSIRDAQHGCTLLVIPNDGNSLPSSEQLERLEHRIQPLLAERGLVLSHDPRTAAFLVRVDFASDPNDSSDGIFAIRTIEPNPLQVTPAQPSIDRVDTQRRAQDEAFRRQEQQLMDENRKSPP